MLHQHPDDCHYRRRPDGSVDVEYYIRVAQAWRRESLRQAFRALLGPIGRLLGRVVRILGATAFGMVRRLVDVCRSVLLVRAQ